MMAITTNSSISVKPRRRARPVAAVMGEAPRFALMPGKSPQSDSKRELEPGTVRRRGQRVPLS